MLREERTREPLDTGNAKKAGYCVGWRCCPDVHQGVALALQTHLPLRAQEGSADSPNTLGLQGSKPRVCAWYSVIQTFLLASLQLRIRLIPLFGIN